MGHEIGKGSVFYPDEDRACPDQWDPRCRGSSLSDIIHLSTLGPFNFGPVASCELTVMLRLILEKNEMSECFIAYYHATIFRIRMISEVTK